MNTISASIYISADPDAVYAKLSRDEDFVRFVPGLESVTVDETNEAGEATRRTVTLGHHALKQRVTARVPGQRFAYEAEPAALFSYAGTVWTLEPEGEGTRAKVVASVRIKWGLPLFFLMRGRLIDTQAGALAGLKQWVEEGRDVSGGVDTSAVESFDGG